MGRRTVRVLLGTAVLVVVPVLGPSGADPWKIWGTGGRPASANQAGGEPSAPYGEITQVINWRDGGELLLGHGERVILRGVYLPHPAGVESFLGRRVLVDAIAELSRRMVGRNVTIYAYADAGPNDKRRLVDVHLENGGWLQEILVSKGVAWVLPYPGDLQRMAALFEAERVAVYENRGLWGTGDFRVRDVLDPNVAPSTYQILRGRIVGITAQGDLHLVQFHPDRRAFPIMVVPRAVSMEINRLGFSPRVGQEVRFRGWLSNYNGPLIQIRTPAQIEVLR